MNPGWSRFGRRRARLWGGGLVILAIAACANGAPGTPLVGGDSEGSDDSDDPIPAPIQPTLVIQDSSAFSVGDRPRTDAGSSAIDASARIADDASIADDAQPGEDAASPPAACASPIGVGDLVIEEIMIASESGTDRGEWVEVMNTRDCTLDLKGVMISSPRGASTDSVSIIPSTLLAPGATFVVADSSAASDNHDLPGMVFSWNAANVLANTGDTVSVVFGTTTVDTLTYPDNASETARSIEFPSDCGPSDRATWERWSLSFDSWTPGFRGTPNAANDDVTCF